MKLTINAKLLNNCIRKTFVDSGTSGNSALNCIKIETDQANKRITFSSTDLEKAVQYSIEHEVEKDGGVLLDKNTMKLIEKIGDTDISISFDKLVGTIQYGSTKIKISSQDPDGLPITIQPISGDKIALDSTKELIDAINKVYPYVDLESTSKHNFNGIYIGTNGDIVATDGRRLSKVVTNIKLPKQVIIPYTAIRYIVTNIGDSCELTTDGDKIQFTSQETIIQTKLIDSNYPDYESVIPKDLDQCLEIQVSSILNKLKVALLVAEQPSLQIKLVIKNKEVLIESGNNEKEFSSKICDTELNDIIIAFKGQYLQQALEKTERDVIKINFKNSNAPVIFDGTENQTVVVMPMKL